MVTKEQIMLTAFDLFSEHGIKNVSMDDIAHNASISKRTLYELFEDKETLLTECINLSYTQMKLSMKHFESEPITALEVALFFYEELMKRPRWFNRKFYDDLKRYPKSIAKNRRREIPLFEEMHKTAVTRSKRRCLSTEYQLRDCRFVGKRADEDGLPVQSSLQSLRS